MLAGQVTLSQPGVGEQNIVIPPTLGAATRNGSPTRTARRTGHVDPSLDGGTVQHRISDSADVATTCGRAAAVTGAANDTSPICVVVAYAIEYYRTTTSSAPALRRNSRAIPAAADAVRNH